MASKFASTIDKSGPFFAKDPGKTFRVNARVMLSAISEEGSADVIAQFLVGESSRKPISHGVQPARVSGHIAGASTALATGKPWQVTAVVRVVNRGFTKQQGIALYAAAASIERRDHVFRRTAGRLKRARAINQAELLKGIA